MERVTGREWLRSASKPGMIALLVAVAVVAYLFIQLGAWQLDRAALRGAEEARRVEAAKLAADPVPLADALAVGQVFRTEQQLLKVRVSGEFREQVLVPGRSVNGSDAVLVVTALWTTDGEATTMIPVLRGWVTPSDVTTADGAAGAATAAAAALLDVPAGPVSLVGYLSDSEKAVVGDFPDGMVGAISAGELANLWGGPTYTGFLVLAESEPASALPVVPPPSYDRQGGMNLQNLFYAAEWFIFGGFAVFVWWRFVREDAIRDREAAVLANVGGSNT
ncbi:MAG: SURF1 family protein [Actinomycetota bacterium]